MRAVGFEISRYRPAFDLTCVSLAATPGTRAKGNVLLSYILAPFRLKPGQAISTTHNNHFESVLIAQTFQDLGYAVDIIDYRNHEFVPVKNYVFFVSARTHLEPISKRLNKDCIKIAHLETAHFLFNNAAAYARALALQQRRRVTSANIRVVEHNLAIEYCDYAAVLGGEFCMDTYRYAGKPMFRLPVPIMRTYPLNPDKNFDACRNHFLWFGSFGFVHKGLDLTLEAFAQTPHLELTVCGRLDWEKDFTRNYHTELYETSNIYPLGWVDVAGSQFLELADRCIAVVFPSCSESESCSVLTCMQAGLIPVVTREAGIDVQDFGILLKDASIGEIQDAVESLAKLPASQLKEMSRKAWEYTRENHSAEKYTRDYQSMLAQILASRSVNTNLPSTTSG
ncbi:MAG: glycosyltransferase [Sulfuricaulis sp.]|uniref:glycosyltransferase n=1 Tax=Sulfuricaulis sp. TaxID=2003553 RepID=UPI003C369D21